MEYKEVSSGFFYLFTTYFLKIVPNKVLTTPELSPVRETEGPASQNP